MQAPSMLAHFREMAAYNRWANTRIYAAAGSLSEDMLHRGQGLYFGSLFGTLAHILQTDRAWTFLLQGGRLPDMTLPPAPTDFAALNSARTAQDALLISWMHDIDDHWLAQPSPLRPASPAGKRRSITAHTPRRWRICSITKPIIADRLIARCHCCT